MSSCHSFLRYGILVAVGTALLVSAQGCGRIAGDPADQLTSNRASQSLKFVPEVQAILAKKSKLISDLAADPVIVAAARQANEKNVGLTIREIDRLDRRWRQAENTDPLIASSMANPCAAHLLKFQSAHGEFSEIFLTDRLGVVVAATDRTSDYYQADESWWQDAFRNGRRTDSHGPIEYDESSHQESIAFCVPVVEPGGTGVLGIIKAVCAIRALKLEL